MNAQMEKNCTEKSAGYNQIIQAEYQRSTQFAKKEI